MPSLYNGQNLPGRYIRSTVIVIYPSVVVPPRETLRWASVAEVFLSDAFDGIADMQGRVRNISNMDGEFDPAWFADLDLATFRSIQNYQCNGVAYGDVHLSGFAGQRYDVGGLDGRWHSFFSDAALQVNALLEYPRENDAWRGSIMKQVSIVAGGGWRLLLDVDARGEAAAVILPEPRAHASVDGAMAFGECGRIEWTTDETTGDKVSSLCRLDSHSCRCDSFQWLCKLRRTCRLRHRHSLISDA